MPTEPAALIAAAERATRDWLRCARDEVQPAMAAHQAALAALESELERCARERTATTLVARQVAAAELERLTVRLRARVAALDRAVVADLPLVIRALRTKSWRAGWARELWPEVRALCAEPTREILALIDQAAHGRVRLYDLKLHARLAALQAYAAADDLAIWESRGRAAAAAYGEAVERAERAYSKWWHAERDGRRAPEAVADLGRRAEAAAREVERTALAVAGDLIEAMRRTAWTPDSLRLPRGRPPGPSRWLDEDVHALMGAIRAACNDRLGYTPFRRDDPNPALTDEIKAHFLWEPNLREAEARLAAARRRRPVLDRGPSPSPEGAGDAANAADTLLLFRPRREEEHAPSGHPE